jgi:5'-methylthioadenosine phosphorylase
VTQEKLAVIGGSGAYHLLEDKAFGKEIDCRTITTPFGPSAPIHRFSIDDKTFLFLSRHGEKDYSLTATFVNYRANIFALKKLGIETIVSWSGPGIINRAFRPGEFILPHDLIDETKSRESTFFKNRGYGFIRQSDPFCPEVREALHQNFHTMGIPHHDQAVYVCTEGPRLETPAEIRKFRIVGADLVGMTLIPETFLARELEICYAPICYLTNFAEGTVKREYQEGQLFEGMLTGSEKNSVDIAVQRFPEILKHALNDLTAMPRNCNCKNAMLRYKNKNMIEDDWTTWIGDI